MWRIQVKRVYEPEEDDDGLRILVDRYWPRGVSKQKAGIDLWLREVAPSAELIKWYGHAPERWPEFLRRYHEELERNPAAEKLLALARQAPVTLVFASSEPEKNNVQALKLYLMEKLAASGETENTESDEAGSRYRGPRG